MNKSLVVLNLKYERLAELYDNTPLRARNIACSTKVNEIAQLTFRIPINNPKVKYLLNEHLIDYNNEYYIIKTTELEHSEDGTVYCLCTCSHLSCALLDNTLTTEEVTPKTPTELMKVALAYENGKPTLGWSIGTIEFGDTIKRGLSISEQSAFSVLCSIADIFGGMLRFRSKDKQVDLLKLENSFDFKTHFIVRKNLKGLKVTYDTSEMVTRLYCVGGELEDGTEMDIMKVNPTGKPYIENYEYYEKLGYTTEDISAHPELFVKTGIFRDTNHVFFAEDLLDDGKAKLKKISYPKIEVSITALDTSLVDEYQPALSLNIGDFVKVIDPDIGVEFECYVIEKSYDDEQPHILNLTVANDIDFKDVVSELFASAKTSSQVITPGGVIQGSHINGISTTQIRNLDVEYCSIAFLTANYIDAKSIASEYAKFSDLEALNIDAINIKTENLSADNAAIKGLLAGNIVSETINTIHLTTENAEIDEAVIKDLIASQITVEDLKAGEIDVKQLAANQADIVNLLAGNIGSELIQTIHLTSENVVIDEAVVKDMIASKITAQDILAGVIDTREINIISSDDGSGINIKDQTMQFVDADGNVRIQIGADATGNFSFLLTGANGTQLLTESGLQAGAIANNFIKNEMVDDNAIKSRNIDWVSSGATVDENGNPVWDTASLTMNGEMFEVSYNKLTETVNDNATNIESLGTDVTVIQGQISSRIWDSDITNAINEYDNTEIKTIKDQYSVINQELEQIILTVGDVQTSIGEFDNELASAVSKITINEGAISSVVGRVDEHDNSILSLTQTSESLILRIDNAETGITNAEKVATNYIKASGTGFIIGDMSADTLGKNVLIDSDSVDIRNGETVLATFASDRIDLGLDASTSVINLCNAARMYASLDEVSGLYDTFTINSSRLRLQCISTDINAGNNRSYINNSTSITENDADGYVAKAYIVAKEPLYSDRYASLTIQKTSVSSYSGYICLDVSGYHDEYLDELLRSKIELFPDHIAINSCGTMVIDALGGLDIDANTTINAGLDVNGPLSVSGEFYGKIRKLNGKSDTRLTDANINASAGRINSLEYFQATGNMTANKPPWDAHVIHMNWDNTGGWDAQIAVRNNSAGLAVRGCNNGLWGSWTQVSLDGHTHSNYVDLTSAQTIKAAKMFDGEQKFYNSSYCPTVNDIASGVGCSMKNARACNNQMIAAEIYAPYTAAADSTLNMTSTAGQLDFHKITAVSGGKITGKQLMASLTGDGLILPNTKAIYTKNSGGTAINAMHMSAANILLIGKGTYDTDTGSTYIYSGGNMQLYVNNAGTQTGLTIGTSACVPVINNAMSLGNGSKFWTAVYAKNGTIQTSDARAKENITPLGLLHLMEAEDGEFVEVDLHSELFDRLQPVQYNFIEGDKKICYGLIAQDVIEAMHEIGISEDELDLVHHDFWIDEETGENKDSYGLNYNNIIPMLIMEVQKLKKQLASMNA